MFARISLSFVLAAAMLAGCDKKNETPAPNASNGSTPAADAAKKTADAAKTAADEAKKTADEAKKAADEAKAKAAKTTSDATKNTTDAAKTATDAAKTTTDTAKANASEWMTKLQEAIKDKKLDDAKTYLDKLEGIKSSLPPEMQTKLTSLKSMYDTAKAGTAGANK
jgi:membrane protein involved in colicin uptake